jgi:hypothetical protein
MLLDGERLRQLIEGAKNEILLCAPFIKADVIEKLFRVIKPEVLVRVVTRWRPEEVVSGVSDLKVFEVCRGRARTELTLLDDLHAKLYLADELGLVGSANLTATALGWAKRNNVEILMPVKRSDPDIQILLRRLESSIPATFAMLSAIEEAAAKLNVQKLRLPEAEDIPESLKDAPLVAWLPRCAAPEKLFKIYQNPNRDDVIEPLRDDGIKDLADLNLPGRLDEARFEKEMVDTLERMPSMAKIIKQVPRQLKDDDAVSLIISLRPDLTKSEAEIQWAVVRDWIGVFFRKFEVAPEKFVTRIRPGS